MADQDQRPGKDRIIDLSIKDTELGFSYRLQSFFEGATELWFKWVAWLFVLGALEYLTELSESLLISSVKAISYTLLVMYFMWFIISIRVEPYYSWAVERPHRIKKFLALLPVAAFAGIAVYFVQTSIQNIVEVLQLNYPS